MRRRNISNQAPATVSLDALTLWRVRQIAAILREFATLLPSNGKGAAATMREAAWLDILASSLEQTQTPDPLALLGTLWDCAVNDTRVPREVELRIQEALGLKTAAPAANICANQRDTVTITLSREKWLSVPDNLRSEANRQQADAFASQREGREMRAVKAEAEAQTLRTIADEIDAALTQPPTPERRE